MLALVRAPGPMSVRRRDGYPGTGSDGLEVGELDRRLAADAAQLTLASI